MKIITIIKNALKRLLKRDKINTESIYLINRYRLLDHIKESSHV